MNNTASQILDSAEMMIRDGGYHAFSFRQIADDLSIKSASVHYHFPSKEALGAAVVKRYTDNFIQDLGQAEDKSAIQRFANLFQRSLESKSRPCLCGILAGESGRLPGCIKDELKLFSNRCVEWLARAARVRRKDWDDTQSQKFAMIFFSALEGAMAFSALHCQPDRLNVVSESLHSLFFNE